METDFVKLVRLPKKVVPTFKMIVSPTTALAMVAAKSDATIVEVFIAEHELEPKLLLSPELQLRQSLKLSCDPTVNALSAKYLPSAQELQTDDPVDVANWPAAQIVQSASAS